MVMMMMMMMEPVSVYLTPPPSTGASQSESPAAKTPRRSLHSFVAYWNAAARDRRRWAKGAKWCGNVQGPWKMIRKTMETV